MESKKDISILYVEDELEIRENYCNILRKEFLNVYEAEDGEKAFKLFKEKTPEILIVDINIPKFNGLEFLKKVREINKNTKIIILTAYTDTDYLMQSTELNLVKYLVKPVTRREFNDALSLAIKQLEEFEIVNKKILSLEDGFRWDFDKVSLYQNLKEIELTKSEKAILNTLFRNPNIELTYDDIIFAVWDDFEPTRKATLKTMINNLRKKLPENTIKTMYKIGYKFNN